jgi:hypothetical protein
VEGREAQARAKGEGSASRGAASTLAAYARDLHADPPATARRPSSSPPLSPSLFTTHTKEAAAALAPPHFAVELEFRWCHVPSHISCFTHRAPSHPPAYCTLPASIAGLLPVGRKIAMDTRVTIAGDAVLTARRQGALEVVAFGPEATALGVHLGRKAI